MDIAGLVKVSSNSLIMDALYNPSSQKSVGEIASDMLVSKEPIKDTVSGTLVDKQDAAAISNFASKLSAVDQELKKAKNTEGADGLREVAKQFASKPEGFSEFMDSVDNLDEKEYQKVFSTVSEISDKGLKIDKFTDTVSSLSDKKSTEAFLNSTNKVLDDDASTVSEKGKTLDKLSSAVAAIKGMDIKESEKSDKLSQLFSSVSSSKNLAAMNKVIANYDK